MALQIVDSSHVEISCAMERRMLQDSARGSFAVTDGKAVNVAVAKDILSYFVRNPDTVDSMTEIARWRLTQELVRRSVEETRDALTWLIEQGYLNEESRVGTESLFQLNKARLEDASRFVKET
jgi:hypothetical protein